MASFSLATFPWLARWTASDRSSLASWAFSASNSGVSSIVRRTHQASATTSTEARNGMRQAQPYSTSSGNVAIGMKTAVAKMKPSWVPPRVNDDQKPLVLSVECSSTIVVAELCSPATARPCSMRNTTISAGARPPTMA